MKPLLHMLGLHFPRDYRNCAECLLWRMRLTRTTFQQHVFTPRPALPADDSMILRETRRELRAYRIRHEDDPV